MAVGESIAFLLAGIVLSGSPGPATLSIAATGGAFGRRNDSVLSRHSDQDGARHGNYREQRGGIGAGPTGRTARGCRRGNPVFWYLPYRIAAAAPLSDTRADRHPSPLIAGTLLTQANPKAYASTPALFLGFVLIGGAALIDAGAKLVILVVIIGTLGMEWLFAGAALTRVFRDPVRNRAMNVVFAALLMVSILFAFVI